MKSKTVKLVSAVVSLGVLSGAYVGVKSYVASQEAKESEEEEGTALVDLDAESVNSVKYISAEENVTLVKSDDTWSREEDENFPLSQSEVNSAVNALLESEVDSELTDVEDLSEYDLDSPQNQITLSTEDGEEEVFDVGMLNDSTGQYYVKKADDDTKVYVVDDSVFEPFMGTVYNFAEAGTFPEITSSTINKVEVEKEDGYTVTEDTDTLSWEVSDGTSSDDASSTTVGNVTSAISEISYDEFVNYNSTDDSEYGFDDPYAVITVDYTEEEEVEAEDTDEETEDAETEDTDTEDTDSEDTDSEDEEETTTITVDKQLVIYIGDEAQAGETRYIKVDGSNEVYTVDEDDLTDILDYTASDFYDLSVGYVSSNILDNVVIETGDETHTLSVTRVTTEEESDDEDGEVKTTTTSTYYFDGEELDATSFSTFYNRLVNMTAQERLTEDYTPEGDPEYKFTITDTDGDVTEVSYYVYDSSFYAAVTGDKVYLVNKMNVRDMEEGYTGILDAIAEADEADE